MKGIAWRVYLGIGALATGACYLLPYDPAGAVLNLVVDASAVAAIAAGVRWHRPVRRLPWWLLAAAQSLFVAGDALFSVNDLVLGVEPFPSLADALYLPGYPVPAAGLALLALSRSTSRDWAGLTRRGHHRHRLRPAVVGAGHGPYLQDPSLGMVELLVSLAYRSGTCSCWPCRPGWPPPRGGAPPRSGC